MRTERRRRRRHPARPPPPAPGERALGPAGGGRRPRTEPPPLTATCRRGAGRRRRPPVAMETAGRPGAALPHTTGNLARFPRRQDPRPHPLLAPRRSRAPSLNAGTEDAAGDRRERRAIATDGRSVTRRLPPVERRFSTGPSGGAGAGSTPPPPSGSAAGSPPGPGWARAGAANGLAKGLGLARGGEGRRLG